MKTTNRMLLVAGALVCATAVSPGCGSGGGSQTGGAGHGGNAGHGAGASGTGGTAGHAGSGGGAAGTPGVAGAGGMAGHAGSGGGAGAAGVAGAGGMAGSGGAGGKAGAAGGGGAAGTAGAGGAAGSAGGAGSRSDGGAPDGGPSDAGGDGALACTDGGAAGSRVYLQLDPTDPERVTNLQWLNSASTLTPNLAASGGPLHCTDPQEFFGQAYGAPEGADPLLVIGGHLATLAGCGPQQTITAAASDCAQTAQLPVTTTYQLQAGARASLLRIARTFGFDASTPVYSGVGIRPYVPRVPLQLLGTVIYPNQAGTGVTSADASACSADCFVSTGATWNGRWFADVDPTSGLALIVLRDPSMTSPVQLTVNNDGFSSSNLASFVLVQPTNGWKAPVTEIESLCFADLTSWPQSQRDAGVLPDSCAP